MDAAAQKGRPGRWRPDRPPLLCVGRVLRASGLAENAVHLGAGDRAEALGQASTGVAHLDFTVERALLLALHAVALVAVGHGPSSVVCRPMMAGRTSSHPSGLSVQSPGSHAEATLKSCRGVCRITSGTWLPPPCVASAATAAWSCSPSTCRTAVT